MDRLGIDIGSKTIKLVLFDEHGEVVCEEYHRHHSRVKNALLEVVHRCTWLYGDREVTAVVTGSAGLRVAELIDVPFVQEVVALKRAVEHYCPGTDVVMEMGGEDTKLVYLTGVAEQRMNTICAGGTGGFIDMMAGMLGVSTKRMQSLALAHSTIYPIASRCAVFAKSDVRPLVNAGARKEDIAASVLEAVCTQAVAGLSAGRPIEGNVVLLGGPFHYIPYLRQAFCTVTGIPEVQVSVPENAHLFVAKGAALSPQGSPPMMLSAFERAIEQTDFLEQDGIRRLPPLFEHPGDYEAFCARHDTCKLPRSRVLDSNENLFLGIDAGSTTLKMALVDEDGALLVYRYESSKGNLTELLPKMLLQIYAEFEATYAERRVLRRSCIIGYGEGFCKEAYGVDRGEVETVAHLRAARELVPDVDFLMDIGGQDIKCFYVEDGMISDIVLNEACSSGCGSLFDGIARTLRMSKERLVSEALTAQSPVDLGTRCSTFMESRVKHAQKDGAAPEDIAAGACYATARNALFKVVRRPDFGSVGKHIVVQGGAFANDALLRAFELETGVEVTRPDISQIMGAWGAALIARDEWHELRERDAARADRVKSQLLTREQIKALRIDKAPVRCTGCTNACNLMVTTFADGDGADGQRVFVTGNRCERGAQLHGAGARSASRPPDIVKLKHALIEACDRRAQSHGRVRIGIPKALALYESYPFWSAFFSALGYEVVGGAATCDATFRAGMSCIPAEGACYPSKLVYGHCAVLLEQGADVLFVPAIRQDMAREGLLGIAFEAGVHECPLIERMPEMLCENAAGPLEGARIVCPDLLGAQTLEDVVAPLGRALGEEGLCSDEQAIAEALATAQQAYRAFFEKLQAATDDALARIDAGEFPGALLAGHAYHADPGIGMRIDEQLTAMGYAVIERLAYPVAGAVGSSAGDAGADANREWFANRELASNIARSAAHPRLQLVLERSFGCGIDAVAADAVHERIRSGADGCEPRVYAEIKLDQIVDASAVRIRLRSLAYANRQRSGELAVGAEERDSWRFMEDDEYERFSTERDRDVEMRARRIADKQRREQREKELAAAREERATEPGAQPKDELVENPAIRATAARSFLATGTWPPSTKKLDRIRATSLAPHVAEPDALPPEVPAAAPPGSIPATHEERP